MNTVISKDTLLKRLEDNKKNHRKKYEEAHKKYREKLIKNLKSLLDRAKKGNKVELYIDLQEPRDHTEDYSEAVEMIKMDVRDEIELENFEFRKLVLDIWDWTPAESAKFTSYTGKSGTISNKLGK